MGPGGDQVTFLLGNLALLFFPNVCCVVLLVCIRVQLMIKYYLNHKPRPLPHTAPSWQDYDCDSGGKVFV